jgi:OmpA family
LIAHAINAVEGRAFSALAKLLKSNPSLRLHVVGHTDNQGKADYNLDLSRRRAASVVRELTGKMGSRRIGWMRSDAGCTRPWRLTAAKTTAPRIGGMNWWRG